MTIKYAPCTSWYENAIAAETIYFDHREIGDLVHFPGVGGINSSVAWAVILTAAMRPYSNGRFATRSGALNYMQLVAAATIPASNMAMTTPCP